MLIKPLKKKKEVRSRENIIAPLKETYAAMAVFVPFTTRCCFSPPIHPPLALSLSVSPV